MLSLHLACQLSDRIAAIAAVCRKEHRIAPDRLIDELRAVGFVAEQLDLRLLHQYVVVAK